MKVTAIKTAIVRPGAGETLAGFLDAAIPRVAPHTVLAITSKVVAILEGRCVALEGAGAGDGADGAGSGGGADFATRKKLLIEAEAERFIDASENSWGVTLAIKNSRLVPNSGIDESNADGMLILWPKDPDRSCDNIYRYLRERDGVRDFGVILTDSTTAPMRTGVNGVAIAYAGLRPLRDLIGQDDLFGRKLKMTRINVIEGLAAAAVLVMGEGAECTPVAVLDELDFVDFVDGTPSDEERAGLEIELEQDLYASFLKRAPWKRGGAAR